MLRAFAFSLLAVVRASSAAKILVIAPTPTISHQLPFHILSKALLWRGYRVTILMTHSMKISHENYTEIDLSVAYRPIRGDYDFVKIYEEPPIKSMNIMQGIVGYSAEVQPNETSVQSFIRSGEPYDLEILEGFIYVCYYGLIHKMGSPPVVKLLTLTAPSSVYYNFGSAINPAFMPDMWLGYSDRMNFWQRLYNTYFYLRLMHMWFCKEMPFQEALMRKHFGPDPPSVYEADRNVSLLITTNHFVMEYPHPHLPNIIDITGIHVATEQKPLSKPLSISIKEQEDLSKDLRPLATYFIMLPKEKDNNRINNVQYVFGTRISSKCATLHYSRLNKATYHAIPLLAIPFFGDQAHNAAKVRQSGTGVWLEYSDVTNDTLLRDIRTVVHDSK
ncbi:UDP-glucosyltransferase 2-like [Schistocerca piceifrons]|uniref:UDP-glucosyltransferase 2-like n=1 Tax=Schistocerca piceifrons TaxID=274613 RepID=UPI001F5EEC0E|nr:UDP-glucosyltransferase 2-like [Schistocerca piceifrons]